jgi:hypothetical protein
VLLAVLAGAPAAALSDDHDLRRGVLECAGMPAEQRRLTCFDALAVRAQEEAEEAVISAVIQRLQRRPHGERVFHLGNGQIWTEVEPGRARYREGLEVRIERTPLGGYVLSTEAGRATRVRRLE